MIILPIENVQDNEDLADAVRETCFADRADFCPPVEKRFAKQKDIAYNIISFI